MRWGLAGGPIPQHLPYAAQIQSACEDRNFSPLLAYAIAWRETIRGEVDGNWTAATVVSGDGGHGLFQLTSSYPPDWADPSANATYALDRFLIPDATYWVTRTSIRGDDLVRCLAASFNAGLGGAWAGHEKGNVDLYTTDNYAADVLRQYQRLATGEDLH